MKPGRKKKPAAKAKAQGNPGHRKIKTTTPAQPSDPSIPEWLDAVGRQVWSLYMPKLALLGYVRDTDLLAFARYCDHSARWLRVRALVEMNGEAYETRSKHGKMLRLNPNFQAMLRIEDQLTKLEDRFGLAPASRESILSRLNEPTQPPILVKDRGTQATGMPSSPVGMLSPSAFARPSGAGGTH